MDEKKRKTLHKIIMFACLIPLIGINIWCGINVYQDSKKRAVIKDDLSEVNSIEYGLLSVNSWKEEIKKIISNQIDDFSLTKKQDSILQVQVSEMLNDLITKAKQKVENNTGSLKGKIRKVAVNVFVDWDDLRKQVPYFSESIVHDLTKPESKERLKKIAKQKLDRYAEKTYDNHDSLVLKKLYKKYDVSSTKEFNTKNEKEASLLENRTYNLSYLMLGILVIFLVPWFFISNYPYLRKQLFFLSVILAMSVLLVGLTSSMIEIDARIKKLDFVLMGDHIVFHNQILFYRSKSILQIVKILLESKGVETVLVGGLILIFSVLFPITKLISTEIYLLGKKKWRKNKLIYWFAFKSGKWSMADVMVVAIFMSYVGFSGILDNQLEALEIHSDTLTSISTNLTSLEPGYILFVAFVLYGLLLSTILKRITPQPKGE